MGWEEGKGLGAKETGMTENLKVKFKSDSKGIGYNNNDYDNVWLDHQDDYEKLLSELGKSNEHQKTSRTSGTTEIQVQTLELNSKSSKARLHYKKFTKSKDLTNATANDLNCILGKEKREKIAATQQSMQSVSVERSDREENVAEIDDSNGGLFSTNKLSVGDYFASKMAARLNKKALVLDEEEKHVDESKAESRNTTAIEAQDDVVEELKERKKSKKSKRRETNEAEEMTKASEKGTSVEESTSQSFNGSSLFNIFGYSPYHINADFKEILNYKIKKSNKKREWTERILKKDEKFYEMNKKKSV